MESKTKRQAQSIIETLAKYDITTELKNIAVGPSVTRFDLTTRGEGNAAGEAMKYGQEIASALGLRGDIRIYRGYEGGVSLEVPNAAQEQISYSDMMKEGDSPMKPGALRFTLGKDVEGHWVHAEIAETRLNRLIVGGHDKMFFLQAMIAELTERYSPADLRLILLDGCLGELSGFRGLPHLIADIVTDPAHAMSALEWGMSEMDRRFSLLNQKIQEGVSAYNIEKYNASCPDGERLPSILIVVDEVNELVGRGEERYKINYAFEERIGYLAMRGHAVGIHLILATEQPMPGSLIRILQRGSHSCVAFQVEDEQASCVLLGEGGAEKLIGNGDLLYRPRGEGILERLQGIDISSPELEGAVVSARKKFKAPSLYKDAVFTGADTVFPGIDD